MVAQLVAHPLLDPAPTPSAPPALHDVLAPDVAGHDDDRVPEVHHPALAVGEPAVVEDLEQHVEDVRVRLLDLVEEDHAVRPPAHRLGELAALLVADVARRRADHPRHRVLLHVLRHVEPHHRALVVEEELGQGPRGLGLADAGGAEEDERAGRPVGITQTRPGSAARRWPPRVTAWSWPTTRCASSSSSWVSRSRSLSIICVTGIPVHCDTISAMSSASTSSFR